MARPRTDDVTLEIPGPLYERLRQAIEGTGFHSVTELSVYVPPGPGSAHAREDEARGDRLTSDKATVSRRRLQSLGYLED